MKKTEVLWSVYKTNICAIIIRTEFWLIKLLSFRPKVHPPYSVELLLGSIFKILI